MSASIDSFLVTHQSHISHVVQRGTLLLKAHEFVAMSLGALWHFHRFAKTTWEAHIQAKRVGRHRSERLGFGSGRLGGFWTQVKCWTLLVPFPSWMDTLVDTQVSLACCRLTNPSRFLQLESYNCTAKHSYGVQSAKIDTYKPAR